MAIHWLAKVPWAEIIANAPRIVEGAKTLSGYLRRPTAAPASPGGDVGDKQSLTLDQEVMALKAKVAQLEAAQASSVQVVQSLANNSEQVAEALQSLHTQAVLNFRLAIASMVAVAALVLAAILFFYTA